MRKILLAGKAVFYFILQCGLLFLIQSLHSLVILNQHDPIHYPSLKKNAFFFPIYISSPFSSTYQLQWGSPTQMRSGTSGLHSWPHTGRCPGRRGQSSAALRRIRSTPTTAVATSREEGRGKSVPRHSSLYIISRSQQNNRERERD